MPAERVGSLRYMERVSLLCRLCAASIIGDSEPLLNVCSHLPRVLQQGVVHRVVVVVFQVEERCHRRHYCSGRGSEKALMKSWRISSMGFISLLEMPNLRHRLRYARWTVGKNGRLASPVLLLTANMSKVLCCRGRRCSGCATRGGGRRCREEVVDGRLLLLLLESRPLVVDRHRPH